MPPPMRKRAALQVPRKDEDPAERARLLNVLAQRRYRERKRARLLALEAKVDAEARPGLQKTRGGSTSDGGVAGDVDFVNREALQFRDIERFLDLDANGSLGNGLDLDFGTSATERGMELDGMIPDSEVFGNDGTSESSSDYFDAIPTHSGQSFNWVTPPDLSINASSGTPDSDQAAPSQNVSLRQVAGYPNWDLQSDSTFVTIPGLALVRAHLKILSYIQPPNQERIKIWDPEAMSPFIDTQNQGSISPDSLGMTCLPAAHLTKLPENYQPTVTQLSIPHHPIFDLFPWPSVRTTMINMLALPPEARPEAMRTSDPSEIVVRLMGDVKDPSGGLRLWGLNCFDPKNWEVGQVFFENWWWSLSGDIVKQSNWWREQRGAPRLNFACRKF